MDNERCIHGTTLCNNVLDYFLLCKICLLNFNRRSGEIFATLIWLFGVGQKYECTDTVVMMEQQKNLIYTFVY